MVIELVKCDRIGKSEGNSIINSHNGAKEEPIYGETLVNLLMNLEQDKKIEKEDIGRLYVLSLDWPSEYNIDLLTKWGWMN